MLQPQRFLPGRIVEIRYALNPADFAFSWGTGPVPPDLTVRTVAADGRLQAPGQATYQVAGSRLLIRLSDAQMRQVFGGPKSLVFLELKWGGLVQIVVEVRASMTASDSPNVGAITVTLPPSVTYNIPADLSAQVATHAAASALKSETNAKASENVATTEAASAATSADVARASENVATAKATSAATSADEALASENEAWQMVGNVLAFIEEEPGVSVLVGVGGSIEATDHSADPFPFVELQFLA